MLYAGAVERLISGRSVSKIIGGKYLMKIIFEIKIETGVLEILDVPNFDKF